MERDSPLEEGDPNVHHVEHRVKPEPMSPETAEATTHKVEVMEVDPQREVIGELVGLDTRVSACRPVSGEMNRAPMRRW